MRRVEAACFPHDMNKSPKIDLGRKIQKLSWAGYTSAAPREMTFKTLIGIVRQSSARVSSLIKSCNDYFFLQTSLCCVIDSWNSKFNWGLWDFSEHSLWIQWKQTSRGPSGSNVPLGQNPVPCRTVQIGKMLFTHCVYASSVQSFNLIAIGRLQRRKGSDVTWLKLVGGVRRETTQDDVISKAKLQDLERLVSPKTVAY
ncbi:hypothetical protein GQ44DRAFT_227042 [Phaeosphaeriaceae sp. PMI808]|nr:hypothetical protein GQ44DRAFT_227042 [Phaeosphaeriaceae sp. PMI808]